MLPIEKAIAPSHSLLIEHLEILPPSKLRGILECYGIVDNIASYRLNGGLGYLSIAQHRETAIRELCYASLRSLSSLPDSPIQRIAWVHEEDAMSFSCKSYIRPLCAAKQDNERNTEWIYLVLYLSDIPDLVRTGFVASIKEKKDAIDIFVDRVSGGRCFLRYPTVEVAEEARSNFICLHPELSKRIHYSDESSVLLARRNASRQTN
ncbi:hypothetical protein DQ04_05761030 [Trypanosoma grayi]|uniref:hypothetical protein n=1 Tax=Trypanosoma grayi TaxID=71804 RepID=UPI0004F48505|nr:hypothetical protein DQ04_05761030 [Trypanosoma grayi]KEG09127.1 hypothetical protein DQ04_05761030 [Trypanosoma grayi]